MTAPLIGIMGRKRAGKDSIAHQLIAEFGVVRLAFADNLRTVLMDANPIVTQYTTATGIKIDTRVGVIVGRYGWEKAKEDPEVRRLLQALGVAVRDHVDGDAWVAPVIEQARLIREQGTAVVITDCRFPNEHEAIRDAGGLLVRVLRPSVALDAASLHISETALDDYPADFVVHNDGDLDALADRISEVGHLAGLDNLSPALLGK